MHSELTKTTDCRLAGFNGPHYPEAVDRLITSIRLEDLTLYTLSKTAGLIDGYDRSRRYLVTSDGYQWLDCLTFRAGRGTVAVLVPQFNKVAPSGAYRFERSMPVYSDRVEPCIVNQLLEALIVVFDKRNAETPLHRASRDAPAISP